MRKLLCLWLLVGCAPASVSLLGDESNYTVLVSNKRGKASVFVCTKEKKEAQHTCQAKQEAPPPSDGSGTGPVAGSIGFDGKKTPSKTADEVRRQLTQPDGCTNVSKEEWDVLKKSSNPDYFYFKGYCTGDVNPEQACNFFLKFIKSSPGDVRAEKARSYIQSQDPSAYPTCVLP